MFQGFSQKTIDFLNDLKNNNNRDWFQTNRERYENELLQPFREFIAELQPFLLENDGNIDTNPKNCISRINRDIRFSKDKSPYRSNMWLVFRRFSKDWKEQPAFYFEIFPDGYRYGMGFYNIPKDIMDNIRGNIDNKSPEFIEIFNLFNKQKVFSLAGEKYKKVLNKELDEDLLNWYQRKELYFVTNKELDDILFSPKIIEKLKEDFKILFPIYFYFLKMCPNY